MMEEITKEDELMKLEDKYTVEILQGKGRIEYGDYVFNVRRTHYSDPVNFRSLCRIDVESCTIWGLKASVMYDEDFSSEDGYLSAMERKNEAEVKACMSMAKYFVKEMLPKVDIRIKIEVNNREVENALEALEG
jgi:predicted RNA-binding protein Jag